MHETIQQQLLRLYKANKVDELALEDAFRKGIITKKEKAIIIQKGRVK